MSVCYSSSIELTAYRKAFSDTVGTRTFTFVEPTVPQSYIPFFQQGRAFSRVKEVSEVYYILLFVNFCISESFWLDFLYILRYSF